MNALKEKEKLRKLISKARYEKISLMSSSGRYRYTMGIPREREELVRRIAKETGMAMRTVRSFVFRLGIRELKKLIGEE